MNYESIFLFVLNCLFSVLPQFLFSSVKILLPWVLYIICLRKDNRNSKYVKINLSMIPCFYLPEFNININKKILYVLSCFIFL